MVGSPPHQATGLSPLLCPNSSGEDSMDRVLLEVTQGRRAVGRGSGVCSSCPQPRAHTGVCTLPVRPGHWDPSLCCCPGAERTSPLGQVQGLLGSMCVQASERARPAAQQEPGWQRRAGGTAELGPHPVCFPHQAPLRLGVQQQQQLWPAALWRFHWEFCAARVLGLSRVGGSGKRSQGQGS